MTDSEGKVCYVMLCKCLVSFVCLTWCTVCSRATLEYTKRRATNRENKEMTRYNNRTTERVINIYTLKSSRAIDTST